MLTVVVLAVVAVFAIALALGVLSPIDAVAYAPPEPLPLSGSLTPNESLRRVELLGENLAGPNLDGGKTRRTQRRQHPDEGMRVEAPYTALGWKALCSSASRNRS